MAAFVKNIAFYCAHPGGGDRLLNRVPEPSVAKNRVHLDLASRDPEPEVERLAVRALRRARAPHRAAGRRRRHRRAGGGDGDRVGGRDADRAGRGAPGVHQPAVARAGIGVGICSSVFPCLTDPLAMARLPRATYTLMLSLLPATATVIGIVVLRRLPHPPS